MKDMKRCTRRVSKRNLDRKRINNFKQCFYDPNKACSCWTRFMDPISQCSCASEAMKIRIANRHLSRGKLSGYDKQNVTPTEKDFYAQLEQFRKEKQEELDRAALEAAYEEFARIERYYHSLYEESVS